MIVLSCIWHDSPKMIEIFYSMICAEADWEEVHSLLCTGEKSGSVSREALSEFIQHANGKCFDLPFLFPWSCDLPFLATEKWSYLIHDLILRYFHWSLLFIFQKQMTYSLLLPRYVFTLSSRFLFQLFQSCVHSDVVVPFCLCKLVSTFASECQK